MLPSYGSVDIAVLRWTDSELNLCRLHLGLGFKNRSVDDGEKLIGFQACTANENSVDAMLAKKPSRIARYDAATILNGDLLGPCLSNDLAQLVSNQQMRIVRLLRILMVQGAADRPYWFVGDTQPG
jgi:hypothetical protein